MTVSLCVFVLFAICTSAFGEEVTAQYFCERLHGGRKILLESNNRTSQEYTKCSKLLQEEYSSEFVEIAKFLQPVFEDLSSGFCKKDLERFLQALKNSSLWAVQMLDASSKLPQGLVTAQKYQLGNFDQCVNLNLRRPDPNNIKGKYCLTRVEFTPLRAKYPRFHEAQLRDPLSFSYDPYLSVWEKFMIPGVPERVKTNVFRSGVCIPSSCSGTDVEDIFNKLYNSILRDHGILVDVTVPKNSCHTNEKKPFAVPGKILIFITIVLTITVLGATWYDIWTASDPHPLTGKLKTLFEAFSMRKNFNRITDVNNTEELEVMHSMKALTMGLIIFGHRLYITFGGPVMNGHRLEQGLLSAKDMYIIGGPIFVDTFLVISGFITCHYLLRIFTENPKFQLKLIYLKRFLRIIPTYAIVVFFYAYLLEHMGDGPLWGEKILREVERCQQSWWANLLFINNYVNLDKICMLQSWYVAVDMHYIILAPLVVRLLATSPRRGQFVLGSLILLTIAIPFYQIYKNELLGVIKIDINLVEDQTKDKFYTDFYIKTHIRALPYLIGIAAAYIYQNLKKSNFRMPVVHIVYMSFLAIIFGLGSYLGAWWIQVPGREYSALGSALFGSFHRLFWSLSMSWVIVACGLKLYGVYEGILIYKGLIPISRLCYDIFLIHNIVQLLTIGTKRAVEFLTIPKMIWYSCADFSSAIFFAFAFHCIFEAPIQGLVNVFIFSSGSKSSAKDKKKDESKMDGIESKLEKDTKTKQEEKKIV